MSSYLRKADLMRLLDVMENTYACYTIAKKVPTWQVWIDGLLSEEFFLSNQQFGLDLARWSFTLPGRAAVP
jgi:hypothetical protein